MNDRERRDVGRLRVALCALIGAAAACAPRASAIIINGTPAQAATNASTWDGIGTVNPQGGTTATGVLIDSTHVMTAAHDIWNDITHSAFSPSLVSFTVNGTTYQASQISVPAAFNNDSLEQAD